MEKAETPRVVAIGASAGGLNAFRELIENLPVDTQMAFVLLTHILRGSKSLLPEILARSTKMQVVEVTEGIKLCPNRIYVLPPDKFMEIRQGSLHLVKRPNKPVNNAVDHFLFSLAKEHTRGSIGIILSGEGSDGAEGIEVLKAKGGGVTMAQLPESARSESMPINAIEIDHVDYILSPKEIAEKLALDEHKLKCFESTYEGPLVGVSNGQLIQNMSSKMILDLFIRFSFRQFGNHVCQMI